MVIRKNTRLKAFITGVVFLIITFFFLNANPVVQILSYILWTIVTITAILSKPSSLKIDTNKQYIILKNYSEGFPLEFFFVNKNNNNRITKRISFTDLDKTIDIYIHSAMRGGYATTVAFCERKDNVRIPLCEIGVTRNNIKELEKYFNIRFRDWDGKVDNSLRKKFDSGLIGNVSLLQVLFAIILFFVILLEIIIPLSKYLSTLSLSNEIYNTILIFTVVVIMVFFYLLSKKIF